MTPACPLCGLPLRAIRRRGDNTISMYGCTGFPACRGALYPDPDNDDRPFGKTCPQCHNGLRKAISRHGTPYVACFNKEAHEEGDALFFEEDGTPRPRPRGRFHCPECGGLLTYFRAARGTRAGMMCFACFSEEAHASRRPHFFDDDEGAPAIPD